MRDWRSIGEGEGGGREDIGEERGRRERKKRRKREGGEGGEEERRGAMGMESHKTREEWRK